LSQVALDGGWSEMVEARWFVASLSIRVEVENHLLSLDAV
jgi:hypothetical protein